MVWKVESQFDFLGDRTKKQTAIDGNNFLKGLRFKAHRHINQFLAFQADFGGYACSNGPDQSYSYFSKLKNPTATNVIFVSVLRILQPLERMTYES